MKEVRPHHRRGSCRPPAYAGHLLGLALLQSCAPTFVDQIVTDYKLEQISYELGINTWKDAAEVERKTATIPTTGEIDMRNYAGVAAPAWSYGGIAVRLAADCGRDNLVHAYAMQVKAYTQSGVYLQVAIEGVGELPPGTSSEGNPWLSFAFDQDAVGKMRRDGAVVRVRCEVGEWVFRLTPSYILGFETKVRSLGLFPKAGGGADSGR